MWQEIQTALPDVHLNGAPLNEGRAGNNLHLLVPGIPSEPLINALSSLGLHASGGSACSTGRFSAVLSAMGRRAEEGAFLRLTLGRFNREDEISEAVDRLSSAINDLRSVYG